MQIDTRFDCDVSYIGGVADASNTSDILVSSWKKNDDSNQKAVVWFHLIDFYTASIRNVNRVFKLLKIIYRITWCKRLNN